MVATTLEAIIGAVFQDGGDQAVTRVIEDLGFFYHPLLTVTSQSLLVPP
jgi:ribonuclease-3